MYSMSYQASQQLVDRKRAAKLQRPDWKKKVHFDNGPWSEKQKQQKAKELQNSKGKKVRVAKLWEMLIFLPVAFWTMEKH